MNKLQPSVTLILGGAASGKSVFAEGFCQDTARPLVYIATAQAFDAEMRAKIDRHIARRGPGWRTIEAPLDLTTPLANPTRGEVCLLDCATLWLSNHLLAGHDPDTESKRLLAAIDGCAADLVIVSNEVGHGIVPDNALGRRFRDAQGRLNIVLAARADLVVQVTAGLPRVLKGTLP